MVLWLFLLKEYFGATDFKPLISNKMQQCSNQQQQQQEALLTLFYNFSNSFFFLSFFFYFFSILLFKFINFLGTPIFPRNEYEYEFDMFSEEEEEGYEQRATENSSIYGGAKEAGSFLHDDDNEIDNGMSLLCQMQLPHHEDHDGQSNSSDYESPRGLELDNEYYDDEDVMPDELMTDQSTQQDSDDVLEQVKLSSRISLDLKKKKLVDDHKTCVVSEDCRNHENGSKLDANLSGDEKFLIFAPTQLETKIVNVKKEEEKEEEEEEEIFGDSYTIGSTSKSSSEWRSSINCRDSGTDDPFSSSSRRSCPKWESYTVFQKYDEEMMFLDRISAQKLHETESLRSIQVCPRSISERIVHKLSTINKKPNSDHVKRNPYYDLEAAYVAQICLTWEALNWNYKNFLNKKASKRDFESGCPGKVAQQFQQFQVLLQRYIENEPYEHGRRPEIYARMRRLAPNLLHVPEYIDSELDEEKEETGYGSRLSTPSFLMIMEDGIRTYMNFLKADKEKPCQILASFFKRKRRVSVDPTLLQLMKKVNQKKRIKLKDVRRAGKCLRKRRLTVEEEMEILMGLIDLKVVSRVLRMADLSEEQLHWCEAKMSKVRILDGKLHRDSSPLFFPAH